MRAQSKMSGVINPHDDERTQHYDVRPIIVHFVGSSDLYTLACTLFVCASSAFVRDASCLYNLFVRHHSVCDANHGNCGNRGGQLRKLSADYMETVETVKKNTTIYMYTFYPAQPRLPHKTQ